MDSATINIILKLKGLYPNSTIIIVSKDISPIMVTRAIKAGADYYCPENETDSYNNAILEVMSEKSDEENISLWKQVLDKLPFFCFY